MAEFLPAFNRTLRREGGLVLTDDPDDHGERTFAGISERWHPSWSGWLLINLGEVPDEQSVRDFYAHEFWLPLLCGQIPSQAIVNELFDIAVNPGPRRAVAWLQMALNSAGCSGLVVDGWIGKKTLAAVCVIEDGDAVGDEVINVMQDLRSAFYRRRVAEDPTQKKYLDGWLARARADDDKETEA